MIRSDSLAYLSLFPLILSFNNNINLLTMFVSECQLQNILGSSYQQGTVLLHKTKVFSPVGSRVKEVDLQHNTTRVLGFECAHTISKLAVNPAGSIMVAVDREGMAILYNLRGEFIIAYFNFKSAVKAIAFSPDGKLLAVGIDRGFRIYESPPFFRSFQPLLLLKKYKNRHTGSLTSLSFTPDSRFLLTSGSENRIYLNNLLPIEDYIAFSFDIHKHKIVSCFFDFSLEYMYSVDKGGNVYVWKWVEETTDLYKNRLAIKKKKLQSRRGGVVSKEVKEEDDELKVEVKEEQDVQRSAKYSTLEFNVQNGRFILAKKLIVSQGGCYLKRADYLYETGMFCTCYSSGKFTIWKLEGQTITEVHSFSVGQHKISSISTNGNWIALAVKELGQLIVWQWKSQSYVFNQSGLIYETTCAAYSTAATVIATGGSDGKVRLWDRKSGFCFSTFEQHESSVTDIKFSNQTTLLSTSLDGSVKAYDTVKYKCFRTLRPDSKCQLQCLAIDPSGEILCAGSFDPYEVYCWNLQTGNLLQILGGHTGPISAVCFVGEHLVSGSWDRTIRIHDFYARKGNADALDQSSECTALAGSPNGKQVAVATLKGQIYIWAVATSDVVAIIDCKKDLQSGRHTDSKISMDNDTNSRFIKSLQFTSCGEYLVAAGKCKHVLVYDIKHRLLIKKYPLTGNRDIEGARDWLNSKNLKEGIDVTQKERSGSEDETTANDYIPGSKKLDVSERTQKLALTVNTVLTTDKQFSVCTNFGVLVYSPTSSVCFSPYELLPKVTPSMLPGLLNSGQYTSAVIVALKLSIPLQKLLAKIHQKHISSVCSDLTAEYARLMIEKITEEEIDERALCWCVGLVRKLDKVNKGLLGALGRLSEVQAMVHGVRAAVGVAQLLVREGEILE